MRFLSDSCTTLSLCFAALLTAGTASASTFHYKVNFIPSDQGDCHQLAKELGDEVHAQTGLPVRRAICTGSTAYGYNVLVEYEADAAYPFVSTIPSDPGVDGGGGVFGTLAACRAALPAEDARFRAATTLTPVISYCTIDPHSDLPYAMRIDAFGHPAAWPQVESWRVLGLPVGTTGSVIEAEIEAGLHAAGLPPSYALYKEAASDGVMVATVYSADHIVSRSIDLGYTDTDGQCLTAVRDARVGLQSFSGGGVLSTVCSYDQILGRFHVTTLTLDTPDLKATAAVERFASFDACYAARRTLIDHYRNDIGRPVIGGVCGRAFDERWAVTLLEQD